MVKNILPFRDSPVLLGPWCISLYIVVYACGIKNSFPVLEPRPPAPHKTPHDLVEEIRPGVVQNLPPWLYLVASLLF